MCIHLNFDYRKATQSLGFLAEQAGGAINKLKALKLIYFADRYHLRKYGRPITNDEYFAMKLGPVASGVKDIAEMSDFLGEDERAYATQYLRLSDDRLSICLHAPLDVDTLSLSDREALTFVWEQFGSYNEFQLAEFTHAYPEWKKHEAQLRLYSRVKMQLEDFFADPTDPAADPCFSLSLEGKQDSLAEFQELSRLEGLWN